MPNAFVDGFCGLIVKRYLVGAIVIFGMGCAEVSKEDVPGFYSAEYEGGRDTLELLPDGRFRHTYKLNGEVGLNEGIWAVDSAAPGKLGISLDRFQFRDHFGGLKRGGVWLVEVEVGLFSRRPELCFDPDLNSCFVKEEKLGR